MGHADGQHLALYFYRKIPITPRNQLIHPLGHYNGLQDSNLYGASCAEITMLMLFYGLFHGIIRL